MVYRGVIFGEVITPWHSPTGEGVDHPPPKMVCVIPIITLKGVSSYATRHWGQGGGGGGSDYAALDASIKGGFLSSLFGDPDAPQSYRILCHLSVERSRIAITGPMDSMEYNHWTSEA